MIDTGALLCAAPGRTHRPELLGVLRCGCACAETAGGVATSGRRRGSFSAGQDKGPTARGVKEDRTQRAQYGLTAQGPRARAGADSGLTAAQAECLCMMCWRL